MTAAWMTDAITATAATRYETRGRLIDAALSQQKGVRDELHRRWDCKGNGWRTDRLRSHHRKRDDSADLRHSVALGPHHSRGCTQLLGCVMGDRELLEAAARAAG